MDNLRAALMPPSVDKGRLARLTRLADAIIDLMDTGGDYQDAIVEFNLDTGGAYTAADFAGVSESMPTIEFVRSALMPSPQRIPDVTYDELLEVMTRVCEARGSESEHRFWLALLQANVPHPSVSTLIYWTFGCQIRLGRRS